MIGERRAVLVQDEFEIEKSCDIAWGITTDADIKLDGNEALLMLKGKELIARILSPDGARFTVESAEQEPPQKRNEGVNRLVIDLGKQTGSVRIAVLFSPRWNDGEIENVLVKQLEKW